MLALAVLALYCFSGGAAFGEETPVPEATETVEESTFLPEGTEEAPTETPAEVTLSPEDTGEPSEEPTEEATQEPTEEPTEAPTEAPTELPDKAEDGSEYLKCNAPSTVSLNGKWSAERKTLEAYYPYDGGPASDPEEFTVPGVLVDGTEALLLEKTFYIAGFDSENSSVLLRADRLFYGARIYVNGSLVEIRTYSYKSEKIDISAFVSEGENRLNVILASGENSVYGAGDVIGVDGDVEIECRKNISIDKIFIDPLIETGGIRIRVGLSADSGFDFEDSLSVNVFELGLFENGEAAIHNGVGTDSVSVKTDGRSGVYEYEMTVRLRGFDGTKLWNPGNPFLYEAVFSVGNVTRTVVFGMRKITVKEDDIYVCVNGSETFLSGITLDYRLMSELGLANTAAMRLFAANLKKLGINTVKGRGIVFSEEWYRICDEAGLFLISEYPLGAVPAGTGMPSDAEQFIDDMVGLAETCYNYASCIIWDLAGESEIITGLEAAKKRIGELDETGRPFSLGLARPSGNGFVAECDVSLLGGELYPGDLSSEAPLLHTRKDVDWNLKSVSAARLITCIFGNILSGDEDLKTIIESDEWWRKTVEMLGASLAEEGFDRLLLEIVEYWRASRKYGGIILPCEVVEAAVAGGSFREGFGEAVRNGFSNIGVNIESYAATGGRGDVFEVDVAVTNNLNDEPGPVEVTLTLSLEGKVIYQETKQYDSLKKLGTNGRDIARREFVFTVPRSIKDGSELQLSASVVSGGVTVSSTRTAFIDGGKTYESPYSMTAMAITVSGFGAAVVFAVVVSFVRLRAYNVKRRKQERK